LHEDETEAHRLHCWHQFLGAAEAWLEMKDRKPGEDMLAEIRFKFGPEAEEDARKEFRNWIAKRSK
jgi:hypothetical protein